MAVFNWFAPHINITIDFYTMAFFVMLLYIFISLESVKEKLVSIEIIRVDVVLRILGGLFWLLIGAIFIENQLSGAVDPTASPYVSYGIGGMSVLIGLLQIFGRYQLAKEAICLVIYGDEYKARTIWKKLLREISEELDEEVKREILSEASKKLKRLNKQGEISNRLYKDVLKIKVKDKELSFEEFSEKYLDED